MHGNLPHLAKKASTESTDRRQLSKELRLRLTNHVAAVLRLGEPTVFAFESACRHGLRSQFCKAGWPWDIADETAARIVSAALAQIGAKRPTYEQGQPEYMQYGVVLFERTHCINCGRKLTGEQKKYCSKRCASAFIRDQATEDERKEAAAKATAETIARRAAYRETAEPRVCPQCHGRFKPSASTQIYCSVTCSNRSKARTAHPWTMQIQLAKLIGAGGARSATD